MLLRVMVLGLLPLVFGGCSMQMLDDNTNPGTAGFSSESSFKPIGKSSSIDKSARASTGDVREASTTSGLSGAAKNSAVQKVALTLTSAGDPSSGSYKIGPLDVLEITVFKVPELSKTAQVSESGSFTYPLIGEVNAGGKTAREVEQKLTRALGDKYLQSPQVSVLVKEYNSQRVTVDGAVKKPGVYPIAGGLTLLQVVARAEGFDANAAETVLILRKIKGQRSMAKFDLTDIRKGKAEDPQLMAGDIIVAPTSDIKEGLNVILRFAPLTTVFTSL